MFFNWNEHRIDALERKLKYIEDKLAALYEECPEYMLKSNVVSCESCGALLYKYQAYPGESEICKSEQITEGGMEEIEFIHKPYYCKKCYTRKRGEDANKCGGDCGGSCGIPSDAA